MGSLKASPRQENPARRSEQANTDMEALYVMQAEICRVLGHPRRIHILDLLSHSEKTATQLRASLGISKVNLSQHLSLLRQAGLIQSRQRGRETAYCIAIPAVTDACRLVRKVLAMRLQQGTRLARTLHGNIETKSWNGGASIP